MPDGFRLRRWLFVWGPALGLMAAIFTVSGVPNLDTSESGVSDKSLHFWTYGALGALLLRALSGAVWRGVTARAAGVAWLLAVAWGALDEWHQAFVAGRSPSSADLLADAAGAAIAVAALLVIAIVRARGRAV